ncbi:MAG TPA: ABC transporter ATP-binding protein [Sandaracinaceae bacterium LLY-WYZ-13_1]|nr:ABC transporter ATP-binding protein [Sandaracinaceae bacterium LLY-WYZ-13_1]
MIEVEELSFTYRGADAPALRDVSLTVGEGEVVGLLGPSGAGKTTLQKVLIQLLPLQAGHARFDGVSVRQLERRFFRRVGVSFEHPNLFAKLTGIENLTAFAGLYDGPLEDPGALLERVGLGDARDRRAAEYSKGMKQRLVLARALLHRPRFLFLDEPTSGLDPGLSQRIRELVAEQRDRGAVVLLTTHDMHLADALCDRVALIANGAVVAYDAPRALKLAHGEHAVRVERRDGEGLSSEVLFPAREADRARLGELLARGDFETVHSQEATLDHVFVQLTGRTLS